MQKSITHEEINELPLNQFNGPITVIENKEHILQVLEKLSTNSVVGFDTETRPSFKKGQSNNISLLQLSSDTECFLIRLNKTGITEELVQFFSNSSIDKVGVGIRDDIRGLQKLSDFEPAGFIELQTMATDKGFENFSLKKLAGILLKFRVSKRQRLSNWDAEELAQGQIVYAATDAWVALGIYKKLQQVVAV
ncbi:3'-5' exonuclease domain-containing protein 2 [bacterium]|nr:3'-5' exonuclease domain-containing protein 2 [bacterium]